MSVLLQIDYICVALLLLKQIQRVIRVIKTGKIRTPKFQHLSAVTTLAAHQGTAAYRTCLQFYRFS